SAGQAFEVDFSQNDATNLFEDPANTLPEITDGQMLLPSEIETKMIPVESGEKYKLQINARVESDFVVEANDRAHIHVLKSHLYRATSTYNILFQDAAGGDIKTHSSTRGFFLSSAL